MTCGFSESVRGPLHLWSPHSCARLIGKKRSCWQAGLTDTWRNILGVLFSNWPINSDEVLPCFNIIQSKNVDNAMPLQFRLAAQMFFFYSEYLVKIVKVVIPLDNQNRADDSWSLWVVWWKHSSSVKLKLIAKKTIQGKGRKCLQYLDIKIT